VKRMFISDLHIGYHLSNYKKALPVMEVENPNEIYLVGDILDLWRDSYYNIKKNYADFFNWIKYVSKNKKIYWILGNHDLMVPKREDTYSNIIFTTAIDIILNDGRRLRIRHGHEYDGFVTRFYPLTVACTWIQESIYRWLHKDCEQKFSLSSKKQGWFYRHAIKKVRKIACELNKDSDIFIMGHTHFPEDTIVKGIRYINTGDWLDDRSYIIEKDGKFSLLNKGEKHGY